MFNYSLIIPHKNTPNLLERCLLSIPNRDDLEVIIVDDNSTPDNIEKLSRLTHMNTTWIFDKSNKGAGHARNLGMEKATGEWLIFADADDYYSKDFDSFLNRAMNLNVDMVFINAAIVDDNNIIKYTIISKFIALLKKGEDSALQKMRFGFWTPWSRITRRRIFSENNIMFEEVPTGNDTLAVLKASKYSQSFEVEPDIMYYYYKPTNGSQTAKAYNQETYSQRLRQRFETNKLYKEVNYPYLWPIFREFRNKSWNKTEKIKKIKNDYNYNVILDYYYFIKRICAKFMGKL